MVDREILRFARSNNMFILAITTKNAVPVVWQMCRHRYGFLKMVANKSF